MDFVPFKPKRVHFIFKKLFEYAFCSIHPEKYAIYFGYPRLSEEETEKYTQRLVASLRSPGLSGKEYVVKDDSVFSFYEQMLHSPVGKTTLREGGKRLGMMLGQNTKDASFDAYMQSMQTYFTTLHLGSMALDQYDQDSVQLQLSDNIFQKCSHNRCYFFEGVFEGILTTYTNTRWHVTEQKCQSHGGNTACLFMCHSV